MPPVCPGKGWAPESELPARCYLYRIFYLSYASLCHCYVVIHPKDRVVSIRSFSGVF
jgi:hypothetical protein